MAAITREKSIYGLVVKLPTTSTVKTRSWFYGNPRHNR